MIGICKSQWGSQRTSNNDRIVAGQDMVAQPVKGVNIISPRRVCKSALAAKRILTCSGVLAKNMTLVPLVDRMEMSARSSMIVCNTSPACLDLAAAINKV
mmetsp:Transcript_35229/g.43510  ORF Transcript_35229/g.43510 Transcript_35229/m.43510 type:complete len:100 (-) Transcript_35229:395-694(-)